MLADFVAKFTPALGALIGICQVTVKQWKAYVDGVSNARGSGVGIILISPKRLHLEKSLKLGFHASNNDAEYKALIVGLGAVQKLGAKEVEMFTDSKLVISQIEGSFEAKDFRMSQYLKLFGAL